MLLAPFLAATAVALVVLWPGDVSPLQSGLAPQDVFRGTVVGVERSACPGTTAEVELTCATPTIRLAEGPDTGRTVTLDPQPEADGVRFEVGDRLVLGWFPDAPEGFQYAFSDRDRRTPLLALAGLFVLAVVALGRLQGLRALLGLVVSLLVLTVFVLPAILEGSSPLTVSLTGAAAIGVVALSLAHGVNVRTSIALLGTLTSLALVGGLAYAFVELSEFSGLADEEATVISAFFGSIDLRGLVLGGVVIGTLGVLDDVTVTQVSAVDELRRANPSWGAGALFRSALRIGRDHIASTVNTLVLAYAGASLPLLLLFTSAEQGLADVANSEIVAVEIVRTLVGSIGLVASVPITTALAARLLAPAGPDGPRGDPRRYRNRKERDFWADAEGLPAGGAEPTGPSG